MNRAAQRTAAVTAAIFVLSASSFATRIWGRITGLGSVNTSSSIAGVRIVTDRGEVYWANVRVLQGPGLIWEADVPSREGWGWHNRNYVVEVRVHGTAADLVRWNPEVAYDYWMGWMPSKQCRDVRFTLKN